MKWLIILIIIVTLLLAAGLGVLVPVVAGG